MDAQAADNSLSRRADAPSSALEGELAMLEAAAGQAVGVASDDMLGAIMELESRLETLRAGHAQRETLETQLGEATHALAQRASDLSDRQREIEQTEITLREQRDQMDAEREEVLAQRRALDARIADSEQNADIIGAAARDSELRLIEQQIRERETLLAQRTARMDGEWVRLEAERAAVDTERKRTEEEQHRHEEEERKLLVVREELEARERELASQLENFAERQESWLESSEELRSAVDKARADAEAAIRSREAGEQREQALKDEFDELKVDREKLSEELKAIRVDLEKAHKKLDRKPRVHRAATSQTKIPTGAAPSKARGPIACLLWMFMVVAGAGTVALAQSGWATQAAVGVFGVVAALSLISFAALAKRAWEPGIWLAGVFAGTAALWHAPWQQAISTALELWELPSNLLPAVLVPNPVAFVTVLTASLTFVFGIFVVTGSLTMLAQLFGASIAGAFLAGLGYENQQVAMAGGALWMALLGASLAHWMLAQTPQRRVVVDPSGSPMRPTI